MPTVPNALRVIFFSVVSCIACGKANESSVNTSLSAAQNSESKLSIACADVIHFRAQMVTLFLNSVASSSRQQNEELRKEGKPACSADLITSYSETTESPKGTIDVTVSRGNTSSQSSYGYPSMSNQGSAKDSGGSGGNNNLSISIKSSLSFPLGKGTVLTCKNIYGESAFVNAALKLVDAPIFQAQLQEACAK